MHGVTWERHICALSYGNKACVTGLTSPAKELPRSELSRVENSARIVARVFEVSNKFPFEERLLKRGADL